MPRRRCEKLHAGRKRHDCRKRSRRRLPNVGRDKVECKPIVDLESASSGTDLGVRRKSPREPRHAIEGRIKRVQRPASEAERPDAYDLAGEAHVEAAPKNREHRSMPAFTQYGARGVAEHDDARARLDRRVTIGSIGVFHAAKAISRRRCACPRRRAGLALRPRAARSSRGARLLAGTGLPRRSSVPCCRAETVLRRATS